MINRLRFATAILCALFSAPAFAMSAAITIPDSSDLDILNPENEVWGWEFSPTVALTVTSLGIFDAGGDGLADIHTIAIWNVGDGSVVTQQLFAPGTGADLVGGFRYIDIAPVMLQADEKYVIGVFYPGSGADPVAVASFDDQFESNEFITTLGGRRNGGGGFSFPALTPEEEAFGPNFRFTPVPLPAAAWLLIGGLATLGGLRRRS